jgi:hypothetical protein
MTLAKMRAQSVRSLYMVCDLCHHEAFINVERFKLSHRRCRASVGLRRMVARAHLRNFKSKPARPAGYQCRARYSSLEEMHTWRFRKSPLGQVFGGPPAGEVFASAPLTTKHVRGKKAAGKRD